MPYWVGLDLGHGRASVCVLDKVGSVVAEQECDADADAITAVLKPFRRTTIKQIGVEAGLGVHTIRRLQTSGFPVRVLGTTGTSRFLQINRLKTDASDARGLAEIVRVGQSIAPAVHVKSLDAQNIRTMLIVRQRLIQQRTKIEQLAQSIVALHGGGMRSLRPVGALANAVDRSSCLLSAGGLSKEHDLQPLVALSAAMRAHLASLDRRIAEMARTNPVCQLLMSVPGVGPITALSFYSAVDDPTRFRRVSDVGTYLGLVPVFYQSGTTTRRGRISKAGSKMTRSHLVTAATTMLTRTRTDSAIKRWGLQLRERAGPGKARVAVARKLAVLLLRLWKTGEPFDPLRLA